jgi:hypothetical protein
MIAQDKLLHFFYGFLIFLVMALVVSNEVALLITLGVAIGKECYDLYIKKTVFDLIDIVFTVLSGTLITLLW